jgi:hypothetical protein
MARSIDPRFMAEAARLLSIASRDPEARALLLWAAAQGLSKKDATTRHAAKARLAERDPAAALAQGVTFERRTPLVPGRAFDAPETERPVSQWAAAAPVDAGRRSLARTAVRVRNASRAPEAPAPVDASAANGEV